MKQVRIKTSFRMFALFVGLILSVGAFAQSALQGHVKDASGEPIIGATVRIVGADGGTITDFDGNFKIAANPGATLSVTYVGYKPAEVTAANGMVVVLQEDAQTLSDVVVIGYGTVKKDDLTGSVTAIKPDEMNRGVVTNPQDLMVGKIAGVQVGSNDGTPGGGSTIRIRGGSSLNASNDPLIVIDGLPMDNKGVQGLANPLSMVNPADIETFTVLKDASATAIYGSRASNGVIIITTKKGAKSGDLKASYNGTFSVSMNAKTLEVMNGDEYRAFIANLYGADSEQYSKLGTYNTDWQDLIYRTAVSTDHNISLSGNIKGQPFRVTLGGTLQDGTIKTSSFHRYTASVNFSPTFFDDHLKVNANLKGMWAKSRFADGGVVGNALTYDPTQPVYVAKDAANYQDYLTSFGGYYQWTGKNEFGDAKWPLSYNSLAQQNPVSTLEYQNKRAVSRSLVGNLELDYKFHFMPDLHIHANAGMDLSTGKERNDIDPRSAGSNYYGWHGVDKINKYNLMFNSYLQYIKSLDNHDLDVTGGYEWQHFHREGWNYGHGNYQRTHPTTPGAIYNETDREWANESYLVSFFGRVNYTLLDRYMLTATVRADGSSKFNKDNRWGYFPSVALAWRLSEESFLKDVKWLNNLKLRAGYGITGQQEGIGEYSYFNSYVINQEHAYYPIIGDGTIYRPSEFNPELTWEKTTTWNAGLDVSILNGRFTASIDGYFRKTEDLLQNVAVAAGSNFKNTVMSNIGTMENKGIEVTLGAKVISTKDWLWSLDYNFTYNKNEITELTTGNSEGYYIPTGGIAGGTGNTVQAHAVGHPSNSFYVYQQVYDAAGKPIENVFVDRNADGVISDADRYFYKKAAPDVMMGLSSKLIYKNWDFSFSLRASFNNYVFNNVESNNCNQGKASVYAQSGFFSNFVKQNLDINFQGVGNYYMSDYFVQNASFLKCDNITLGYSFKWLEGSNARVYAAAQNVFTITDYKGLDPEVGGIDNNIYPRPFTLLLGVNLNF